MIFLIIVAVLIIGFFTLWGIVSYHESKAINEPGRFQIIEVGNYFYLKKVVRDYEFYVMRTLPALMDHVYENSFIYSTSKGSAQPFSKMEYAIQVAEYLRKTMHTENQNVVWNEPVDQQERLQLQELVPELIHAVDTNDREKEIHILEKMKVDYKR